MTDHTRPTAVAALDVAPHPVQSTYPEPFFSQMQGREKRRLGDVFGLANFGVNLTRMAPGSMSALRHSHTKQDEFVYILAGCATLITDAGETELVAGMCAGFKAGSGDAHQLINRGETEVLYLEVGDRIPGDGVDYPDVDLAAVLGEDQKWRFARKDGTSY